MPGCRLKRFPSMQLEDVTGKITNGEEAVSEKCDVVDGKLKISIRASGNLKRANLLEKKKLNFNVPRKNVGHPEHFRFSFPLYPSLANIPALVIR